ncbi:MAG: DUF362 domain-containing protein [Deltaproteobacteria bacterium]|nr:DUF362 domain-containing protein [Deltaproteobacteria bacterium]
MLTRRTLLGLAAALPFGGCRLGESAPDATDHAAAVLAAIERAGGLGFVRRRDRVLLKVNTNSGDPFPYSTSPTTVRTIARALIAAGAHVTVGDRSFWGDDDTAGNLEANGIAGATRDTGAKLVVFDDSIDWIEIDPKLVPHWKPPFRLPRIAVEADHLINLACLKTHFISGVTLGLKNLLGLVNARDRARPGNLRSHDAQLIHHQIADVHRAIAPRLTVIDGYRALIAGGPTRRDGSPATADLGVVLAGKDRVALEVSAIALLQKHAVPGEAIHATAPDKHPTILAARAAGLA